LLRLVLVVLLFLETEWVVWRVVTLVTVKKQNSCYVCARERENLDKTSSYFQLLMMDVVVTVVDGFYQNDGSFCSKQRLVLL